MPFFTTKDPTVPPGWTPIPGKSGAETCRAGSAGDNRKVTDDGDALDDIGVLRRREIEARILGPLLAALGEAFGHEGVREIARGVIARIAEEHGAALADRAGDDSLGAFAAATENWRKGGALEIEVVTQTDERYEFNVTRCRYADMYRALGLGELGAILSCNRDASLIGGFNPTIDLTRTQTIMEGAARCDFRYAKRLR
jgi:predicted ArsR family transcriptional regulator